MDDLLNAKDANIKGLNKGVISGLLKKPLKHSVKNLSSFCDKVKNINLFANKQSGVSECVINNENSINTKVKSGNMKTKTRSSIIFANIKRNKNKPSGYSAEVLSSDLTTLTSHQIEQIIRSKLNRYKSSGRVFSLQKLTFVVCLVIVQYPVTQATVNNDINNPLAQIETDVFTIYPQTSQDNSTQSAFRSLRNQILLLRAGSFQNQHHDSVPSEFETIKRLDNVLRVSFWLVFEDFFRQVNRICKFVYLQPSLDHFASIRNQVLRLRPAAHPVPLDANYRNDFDEQDPPHNLDDMQIEQGEQDENIQPNGKDYTYQFQLKNTTDPANNTDKGQTAVAIWKEQTRPSFLELLNKRVNSVALSYSLFRRIYELGQFIFTRINIHNDIEMRQEQFDPDQIQLPFSYINSTSLANEDIKSVMNLEPETETEEVLDFSYFHRNFVIHSQFYADYFKPKNWNDYFELVKMKTKNPALYYIFMDIMFHEVFNETYNIYNLSIYEFLYGNKRDLILAEIAGGVYRNKSKIIIDESNRNTALIIGRESSPQNQLALYGVKYNEHKKNELIKTPILSKRHNHVKRQIVDLSVITPCNGDTFEMLKQVNEFIKNNKEGEYRNETILFRVNVLDCQDIEEEVCYLSPPTYGVCPKPNALVVIPKDKKDLKFKFPITLKMLERLMAVFSLIYFIVYQIGINDCSFFRVLFRDEDDVEVVLDAEDLPDRGPIDYYIIGIDGDIFIMSPIVYELFMDENGNYQYNH